MDSIAQIEIRVHIQHSPCQAYHPLPIVYSVIKNDRPVVLQARAKSSIITYVFIIFLFMYLYARSPYNSIMQLVWTAGETRDLRTPSHTCSRKLFTQVIPEQAISKERDNTISVFHWIHLFIIIIFSNTRMYLTFRLTLTRLCFCHVEHCLRFSITYISDVPCWVTSKRLTIIPIITDTEY